MAQKHSIIDLKTTSVNQLKIGPAVEQKLNQIKHIYNL